MIWWRWGQGWPNQLNSGQGFSLGNSSSPLSSTEWHSGQDPASSSHLTWRLLYLHRTWVSWNKWGRKKWNGLRTVSHLAFKVHPTSKMISILADLTKCCTTGILLAFSSRTEAGVLGSCLADRDSALPAQRPLSRTGSSPGSQRKDVHRTLPLLHMEEGKPGGILHTAAVDSFWSIRAHSISKVLPIYIYAFVIWHLMANFHSV